MDSDSSVTSDENSTKSSLDFHSFVNHFKCDLNCNVCIEYIRRFKQHVSEAHGEKIPEKENIPKFDPSEDVNITFEYSKFLQSNEQEGDFASPIKVKVEPSEVNSPENVTDNPGYPIVKPPSSDGDDGPYRKQGQACTSEEIPESVIDSNPTKRRRVSETTTSSNTSTSTPNHSFFLSLHSSISEYDCRLCNFQVPTSISNYSRTLHAHFQRSHPEQLPFICKLCFVQFKKYGKLMGHGLREHNPEHIYPCPKCEEIFHNFEEYNAHMNSHQKRGAFFCGICQLDFRSRVEFLEHKNSHPVGTGIQCMVCGICFPLKNELNNHHRKEHAMLTCNICGNNVIGYLKLRQHYDHEHPKEPKPGSF